MKTAILTILTSLATLSFAYTQTRSEISQLLDSISKIDNSKFIATEYAESIVAFEENALLILSQFFVDSTSTRVYSECQERPLKKGEIAIILADRVEIMPYYTLTGIQNCLLSFCDGNPNFIEYYLARIEDGGVESFYSKYTAWLLSDDRVEWKHSIGKLSKKEMKKELRKRKKKI